MSAAMLRALSTATLTPCPLPDDGPRWRPLVTANLEREYDQVVIARVDGAQVQPLHDGDATPQQNLMGPRRRRAELFCRDVVHADQHHARICKQLGRVR